MDFWCLFPSFQEHSFFQDDSYTSDLPIITVPSLPNIHDHLTQHNHSEHLDFHIIGFWIFYHYLSLSFHQIKSIQHQTSTQQSSWTSINTNQLANNQLLQINSSTRSWQLWLIVTVSLTWLSRSQGWTAHGSTDSLVHPSSGMGCTLCLWKATQECISPDTSVNFFTAQNIIFE